MFTGIIQAVGSVATIKTEGQGARLSVKTPRGFLRGLGRGDSVAVNGCCLTVIAQRAQGFDADLAAETLARTSLGSLSAGAAVNLEAPLLAGAPLSGHILQGHVEATGRLLELKKIDPRAGYWMTVRTPRALLTHIVAKGSLAVDGISLTVALVHGDELGFAIIPYTYRHTRLHTLAPGAAMNLETDAVTRQRTRPSFSLSVQDLILQGF